MPITVGYTPAKLAGDLAAQSGRNRGALLAEQVRSGRIADSIAQDNLKLAKRRQTAQEDEADRRNELAQQQLDQQRRDTAIRQAMQLLEMGNRENALAMSREIQDAQRSRDADRDERDFLYTQTNDAANRASKVGGAATKAEAKLTQDEAAGGRADERIAQTDKSLDLRANAQAMQTAARLEADKLLRRRGQDKRLQMFTY